MSFNPLPSQKQGETSQALWLTSEIEVSIRSPHKSKGRPPLSTGREQEQKFQSAPLTKARGDNELHRSPYPNTCFNPLPSQKQGETLETLPNGLTFDVSIRSPHKSKGRQAVKFNFLKEGEVSIRSPHKSKGRLDFLFAWYDLWVVSIRSPHKSKGRQHEIPWWVSCIMFQSAPLTKARGDRNTKTYDCLVNQFQSAPLTKARGDHASLAAVSPTMSFNPLPSQKQGETATGRPENGSNTKFQSAPLTKARGDLPLFALAGWFDRFQSAPLTKARGDLVHYYQEDNTKSFNPLPSQKQGETRYCPSPFLGTMVSIRSPHKSKGRLSRCAQRGSTP